MRFMEVWGVQANLECPECFYIPWLQGHLRLLPTSEDTLAGWMTRDRA